ncbi:MAG: hypothetical protein MZV70_50790 [Desulfobacterales bacterium]|nr:hypothetical protein [Desulfobacterales bacterium]
MPFDERYVTYVWFDALLNYVSGARLPGRRALPHVLAGGPAHRRQGHPQAPRHLLAAAC